MVENNLQLRVTLQQMLHMINALEAFRAKGLEAELKIDALCAEGPLDMLDEMRRETIAFARQLPEFNLSEQNTDETVPAGTARE